MNSYILHVLELDIYDENKMCLRNTNAPDNGQFQGWSRSQGQISE